jgi:hypothetical protein
LQVAALVAWNHGEVEEMTAWNRCRFMLSISPPLLSNMVAATFQSEFNTKTIQRRRDACNADSIRAQFRNRKIHTEFSYSLDNMDDYGDICNAIGSKYLGPGVNPVLPAHIGGYTFSGIEALSRRLARRNVTLAFCNIPYIQAPCSAEEVRHSNGTIRSELAAFGPVIDEREEVTFDRKYFYDTNLHLNEEGRRLRTAILIKSIREMILPGQSAEAHPNLSKPSNSIIPNENH